MALSTQDRELVSILKDLNDVGVVESTNGIVISRLLGAFVPIVFLISVKKF